MQNEPVVNKSSKEMAKSKITSKIQDRFQQELQEKEQRMKKLKDKYSKIEEDKISKHLLFKPNLKP